MLNNLVFELLSSTTEDMKKCHDLNLNEEKQKAFADDLRMIAHLLYPESEEERRKIIDRDTLLFRKKLGALIKEMDIWLLKHGINPNML